MEGKQNTPVRKIVAAVLVLVLLVIAGVGIGWYLSRERSGLPPEEKGQRAEEVTPPVTVPDVAIPGVPDPTITVPDAAPPSAAGRIPAAVDVCAETRERLRVLFSYLDRQEYIAARRLEGGSFGHFQSLLARLLKRPPFVMRETDDLLRVLQNRAHFFRVLGKENTLLIREILRKEGHLMESAFATLYQAMSMQEQCTGETALQAPLKDVYPYAVYFLNTLGGSSYLNRRDSRVRMLTQYYSILILDRANQQRLNHLGLDIRPPLDALLGDLQSAANLNRKKEYIATLRKIREKRGI